MDITPIKVLDETSGPSGKFPLSTIATLVKLKKEFKTHQIITLKLVYIQKYVAHLIRKLILRNTYKQGRNLFEKIFKIK